MSYRLQELREARGLSRTQIAEVLCLSRSGYSYYESGKRQPGPEVLSALADYYGVSTDYLLGASAAPQPALSREDGELLRRYHLLDERGRSLVDRVLAEQSGYAALIPPSGRCPEPSTSGSH